MTPLVNKNVHELHVKIPVRFKEILFRVSQITKDKTVSAFVRRALIEKCRETLNGSTLLDTIIEDIDYLETLQKEKS